MQRSLGWYVSSASEKLIHGFTDLMNLWTINHLKLVFLSQIQTLGFSVHLGSLQEQFLMRAASSFVCTYENEY